MPGCGVSAYLAQVLCLVLLALRRPAEWQVIVLVGLAAGSKGGISRLSGNMQQLRSGT